MGRFCSLCGRALPKGGASGCPCAVRRDTRLHPDALPPPDLPPGFWDHEPLRAAFAERHVGHVIRAFRTHPHHGRRGLSQEIVAGWAGITQAQVSRIENGSPVVHLDRLIGWARLLGMPSDLLWFELPADGSRPAGAAGPAGRSTEGAGPVVLTSGRPPSQVDASLMETVVTRLRDYKIRDGVSGPGSVLPDAVRLLTLIDEHARAVAPDARRDLLQIGADAAEFAGWLCRDLLDLPAASSWYDRAMEWAQEAQDDAMQMYILIRKSQMAYDRRDLGSMSTLADAAAHVAQDPPRAVEAERLQQEALVLAVHGESLREVEQRLERARQLVRGRPGVEPVLGHATLALREAVVYTEAGQPARAVTILGAYLRLGGPPVRDGALCRARWAIALALSGEPEKAARTALDALRIAQRVGSRRTAAILTDVIRALEPWRYKPATLALRSSLAEAQVSGWPAEAPGVEAAVGLPR